MAAAQPQSRTALKAGRQTIRQTCAGKEGRGRGRETNKQRPQACTIRRSQARQAGRQSAVVVVEIGCETVSHGITITTHTNARVHVHTNTHTQQDRGAAAAQVILLPSAQASSARERERAAAGEQRDTHIHAQRIRKQKP